MTKGASPPPHGGGGPKGRRVQGSAVVKKNKSRTFRLTPLRRIGWIIAGRRFQKRRTQIMPVEDRIAARLLDALAGLDLTSADGRAGIHTLLSEIERACPGVLLQQAARMELRAVGWGRPGSER